MAYNKAKNNSGFATLLISVLSFVIPGLINFFKFTFDLGIVVRYNIPMTMIFPYDDNILNYIFIFSFCSIIYVLTLFFIYKSIELIETKIMIKFTYFLLAFILSFIFTFLLFFIFFYININNIVNIILLLFIFIMILMAILILLSPAYYYRIKSLNFSFEINNYKIPVQYAFKYISNQILVALNLFLVIFKIRINQLFKKNYNNFNLNNCGNYCKNKTSKYARIILSFFIITLIVVLLFLCVYLSYKNTFEKKEYIIVNYSNSCYAVIYERSSQYLITPCTIDDASNKIVFTQINNHILIDNVGVEYAVKTLTPQNN